MNKTVYAAIAAGVLASVPVFLQNDYITHIGVMIGIFGTVAVAINMVLQVGQLSFAHVAFMAVGAYVSALLSLRLQVPVAAALGLGGVTAALAAYVIGPLVLRVRGVYFVLLTFAFSEILNLSLQEATSITGGNSGLYGIPRLSIFGWTLEQPVAYYVVALTLLALTFVLAATIRRRAVGKVLSCLDENEALAQAFGVEALKWRNWIFTLSALLAGLAGAVYAHYLGFISPVAFSFHVTLDAIIMNVVGGLASPVGALLGALLIVPLPELMREMRQFQLLSYAVALMGVLLFMPNGVLGLLARRPKRG